MSNWRDRLLGFTGLYVLFGIWAPLLWFIVSSREFFQMESFEFSRMHWFSMLVFAVLLVATLVAQFGFVVIAQEHAELERFKQEHSSRS